MKSRESIPQQILHEKRHGHTAQTAHWKELEEGDNILVELFCWKMIETHLNW
jgi:hypothetical protein